MTDYVDFDAIMLRWKWEDNVGFGGRSSSPQLNHLRTLFCLVGLSLVRPLLLISSWRLRVMRSHFLGANLVLRYNLFQYLQIYENSLIQKSYSFRIRTSTFEVRTLQNFVCLVNLLQSLKSGGLQERRTHYLYIYTR